MKHNRSRRQQQLRGRIATEAARIIVESGRYDLAFAKRKAAQRLRVDDPHQMPTNEEVETALGDYQRLFRAQAQPARLRHLREAALGAMELLRRFKPCLVGPVLSGTADEHSDVRLHVFAEPAEEVDLFFLEHRIAHRSTQERVRLAGGGHAVFPALHFSTGGATVEVLVLGERERRHAPISPIDGRPEPRANLSALRRLLESDPRAAHEPRGVPGARAAS